MQADTPGWHTSPERHGEFPARACIQPKAVFYHPARHFGAQERLARIINIGTPAEVGERMVEGFPERLGPASEVSLVEHVCGVPYCRAISRTSTPPTSSAPASFRCTVHAHKLGSSSLASGGGLSHAGTTEKPP